MSLQFVIREMAEHSQMTLCAVWRGKVKCGTTRDGKKLWHESIGWKWIPSRLVTHSESVEWSTQLGYMTMISDMKMWRGRKTFYDHRRILQRLIKNEGKWIESEWTWNLDWSVFFWYKSEIRDILRWQSVSVNFLSTFSIRSDITN